MTKREIRMVISALYGKAYDVMASFQDLQEASEGKMDEAATLLIVSHLSAALEAMDKESIRLRED